MEGQKIHLLSSSEENALDLSHKTDFQQLYTLLSETFKHHVSVHVSILDMKTKLTLWSTFVIDFHM